MLLNYWLFKFQNYKYIIVIVLIPIELSKEMQQVCDLTFATTVNLDKISQHRISMHCELSVFYLITVVKIWINKE